MSNCSRRRRRWAPRHSQMMCAPSHAVRGIERARGAAITWAEHHISRARVQLPPGDRNALSSAAAALPHLLFATFGDSAFLSHEADELASGMQHTSKASCRNSRTQPVGAYQCSYALYITAYIPHHCRCRALSHRFAARCVSRQLSQCTLTATLRNDTAACSPRSAS